MKTHLLKLTKLRVYIKPVGHQQTKLFQAATMLTFLLIKKKLIFNTLGIYIQIKTY